MDVRIAIRVLEAALGRPATTARLTLGPEAKWFVIDGRGRVDLSRRGPIRRVLARLHEAHRARAPALTLIELQQAGWPGQKIRPESAKRRVYVAIGELRKLGLGDLIVTRDDGYQLDPDVTIAVGPRAG